MTLLLSQLQHRPAKKLQIDPEQSFGIDGKEGRLKLSSALTWGDA
jgi:hypothetical protein